ncbi:MAG: pyridoxal phosphate-dependent aminotransferase [Alphaproteobacteria bacterium]|jgi:aspartate aminotransferase|nr:pyridoxal phosphate-dependent aminotransferase [Alphaproteobacteria bacterium]MBU0803387.1 pyridoxal phosphate-dependent aminotransferase [Alphaproteobacteria bacterium]MBU0871923.1 pyridoxal phosphate-dependent aminotransferase [Alphaproteobacteria bacterium]MBU1402316.1 pyridoxal phosphate-dependent aminotransferase [Alphaproteobacteria bacterium]MBU1590961.1 pyridoxal phosphate-dependent aminotransferase [Alphaproteobacteria bacterium]
MPPQASVANPRFAFDGIRAQIRDLHTESIADLAIRARELGDVIPLWYGEGDMVTPPFIREAAKAALDEGQTFYIPNMHGYGPLNEALAGYQTRLHGRDIPVSRTTVTPGGMQALFMALELLVDTGTNVVYVAPQWPNIHNAIHLVGGEPRPFSLDFDGDWKLDLDGLFAACDARTRAIFLSTPSNPTGWTASREEMLALLEFSRRTGIWIISDEVYGRLYFDAPVAPSILQIAEDGDRVLSVNSFSKAWAMTGWRIGWLTHPSAVAGQIGAMTQLMNSGTSGSVQAGATAAILEGEPLVEEIRQRIRTGLDLAYGALAQIPGMVLPTKPRGGMYAFFAVEGEADARKVCADILEKARVGLAPGYLFGSKANAFLRMCVCRERGQIETALGRMLAMRN